MNIQKRPKTRVEWIDAAKGVGILLIMVSHVLHCVPHRALLFAGFIPLFFFLSGLVVKSSSIGNTVSSKGKRLLIPLLVYSIVGLSLLSIFENYSAKELLSVWIGPLYQRIGLYVGDFKSVRFLRGPLTPLWFLSAMFVSYVFFAFYCKLCKKSYGKFVFTMLLFVFGIYIQYSKYLLPWSLDTAPVLTLFIIGAYELRDNILNLDVANHKFLTLIAILIIALVYYPCCKNLGMCNISIRNYGSSIEGFVITSTLYIAIICLGCRLFEKSFLSKALAWIGSQSLRLMCLHVIVYYILGKYGLEEPLSGVLAIILSMAISAIISEASKRVELFKYI